MKLILIITLCLSNFFSYSQEIEFDEDLYDWIIERIEVSSEKKEIIQIPIAARSFGWGCMCPDYYFGISTNMQEGPWIHPVGSDNFPMSDSIGTSIVVKGYFTGKYKEIDLRNEDGEPEEWLYNVPEFQILKWKLNTKDYSIKKPRIIKFKKRKINVH